MRTTVLLRADSQRLDDPKRGLHSKAGDAITDLIVTRLPPFDRSRATRAAGECGLRIWGSRNDHVDVCAQDAREPCAVPRQSDKVRSASERVN